MRVISLFDRITSGGAAVATASRRFQDSLSPYLSLSCPRPAVPLLPNRVSPPNLLPRQNHPHLCFGVSDQFAANIHRHAVNHAGKRKRRLVFRSHRSANVHAADYAAEQADSERVGQLDIALSDQPGVEVELALAGCAFAVGDVGFARHLELKAQLVTSCGNGLDRFDVIEVPADVVVGIAELAVLNIKASSRRRCRPGTAARLPRRPWGSPRPR